MTLSNVMQKTCRRPGILRSVFPHGEAFQVIINGTRVMLTASIVSRPPLNLPCFRASASVDNLDKLRAGCVDPHGFLRSRDQSHGHLTEQLFDAALSEEVRNLLLDHKFQSPKAFRYPDVVDDVSLTTSHCTSHFAFYHTLHLPPRPHHRLLFLRTIRSSNRLVFPSRGCESA